MQGSGQGEWVFGRNFLSAHREILRRYSRRARIGKGKHCCARPRTVGKECGSVLGSHFQGSGRCENASGRLCLRTRHHVRAISTDGSCLLPQHCAKTTPCLSTTLFTLARPSPQAELTTSLQPNLYFPLPRNKVINKENYFQLVLTRGKKEREDK